MSGKMISKEILYSRKSVLGRLEQGSIELTLPKSLRLHCWVGKTQRWWLWFVHFSKSLTQRFFDRCSWKILLRCWINLSCSPGLPRWRMISSGSLEPPELPCGFGWTLHQTWRLRRNEFRSIWRTVTHLHLKSADQLVLSPTQWNRDETAEVSWGQSYCDSADNVHWK